MTQLVFVARGAFPRSTPCVCALQSFLSGQVFPDRTTRRHGLARPPPNWVGWAERVVTLWPHTSMATQKRAQIASARGPVGMQKCRGDPRHWFAPTTPAGRVVDARTTRCVDFNGHILLWLPKYAHEWSVHAARLGCRNVGGTFDIGLHPLHPLIASWTHALPGVWTCMATYFYGHPRTRRNGQCTRPGWVETMVERFLSLCFLPPHALVASWTHALPGVWFSMATYFYGHPSTRTNGHCTRPGSDAETLGGTPDIGFHTPHPLIASLTHALPGVCTL